MGYTIAFATWTAFLAWLGIAFPHGYEAGSYVALVRTWGPVTAIWVVGVAVIGLVLLIRRRGWPSSGAAVLLVAGITVMLAGSLSWVLLRDDPAATILLLSVRNSTLWRVLLLVGAASYGLGLLLAWRLPRRGEPPAGIRMAPVRSGLVIGAATGILLVAATALVVGAAGLAEPVAIVLLLLLSVLYMTFRLWPSASDIPLGLKRSVLVSTVVVLVVGTTAWSLLFSGPPIGCLGFGGAPIAYRAHTTLADAGLSAGSSQRNRLPGDLSVTADPVALPHGGVPDFSAPPVEPQKARMYCFHPDGTGTYYTGTLPTGWQVPDHGE